MSAGPEQKKSIRAGAEVVGPPSSKVETHRTEEEDDDED